MILCKIYIKSGSSVIRKNTIRFALEQMWLYLEQLYRLGIVDLNLILLVMRPSMYEKEFMPIEVSETGYFSILDFFQRCMTIYNSLSNGRSIFFFK